MTRRLQFTVLLIVVAALSGCTNFFYSRLDTLAAWYIQDLVTLDTEQRSDLNRWLDGVLEWHRQSELGRYAKFVRELADQSAKPGTAASYKNIEQQVEQFGTRLVEQTVPDAARLLMELSPQQLDEFEQNLADKARERNEKDLEALKADKWHDKRAQDIEKQLKRWTGAVTKEQHQLIAQLVTQFQPTTTDWLESQSRWRKSLFGALRERLAASQSPSPNDERILSLLRTPETEWTAAYQAKATHNRAQSLEVLTSLDASLTPSQRIYLQRELNKLAQQLEGMATSS